MREQTIFRDRQEAGRLLALKLSHYKNDKNALILALPRGGVPVAYEIAVQLNLPLDIFLVRKLGVPGQEELAMGAIASGNVKVINDLVVEEMCISQAQIDAVERRELEELKRRDAYYRQDKKPLEIAGKKIILVDDGIATGSTMKAALLAIKKQSPSEVIIAVAVSPVSTVYELLRNVDDMICLETPEPFYGVGRWYENFPQTTDSEVRRLLAASKNRTPSRRPGSKCP